VFAVPRVSAAASGFMPPLVPGSERPKPPTGLAPDARAHWLAIVGGLPPNWFGTESLAPLKSLCRFLDLADVALDAADKALQEGDDQRHAAQIMMANRASNMAIRLGTQLRVSPKSRSERGKQQNEQTRRTTRPWEVDIGR
jgi:hypothetical protein